MNIFERLKKSKTSKDRSHSHCKQIESENTFYADIKKRSITVKRVSSYMEKNGFKLLLTHDGLIFTDPKTGYSEKCDASGVHLNSNDEYNTLLNCKHSETSLALFLGKLVWTTRQNQKNDDFRSIVAGLTDMLYTVLENSHFFTDYQGDDAKRLLIEYTDTYSDSYFKLINTYNNISYLTDTHFASKKLQSITQYIMLRNNFFFDNRIFVIHTHIETVDNNELIRSLYLSDKKDWVIIAATEYRNSICKEIFKYALNISDYFSYSFEEFKYYLQGLAVYSKDTDEILKELWDKISDILKDKNPINDNPQKTVAKFSFNLDLEMFEDAKDYWNKQCSFHIVEKNNDSRKQIHCYVSGAEKNSLVNISICPELRDNALPDENYFKKLFINLRDDIIHKLPSRIIIVCAEKDFGHYECEKTISMYTPSNSAENCLLFLQTFTGELAPYPQGYFAGYTFQKDIYVPKCEFYWSDEQLIQKYKSSFK